MDGETRVSLHCFAAGCDGADILAAIGLTIADRYHQPKVRYTYERAGQAVRVVTRDALSKSFRQTGIVGGPTLYRLDRLADAATVYLVEGEEDVHALEAAGVVATTAPMGAGNFAKADITPLYGKKIIAVVDTDEPGGKWAATVRERLGGQAELTFVKAKVGKDASDHLAAGVGVADFEPWEQTLVPARRIRLTPASVIKPRPVRWTWTDRIPAGEFTLTPGRGGIGKSTFHVWAVAHLTGGTLPGVHFGEPKPCIIAASEDSWERTIVPRLIAAGAVMEMVYRVDVVTETDTEVSLSLPRDIDGLAEEITHVRAGLLSVDPVMSVISSALDSHKDADVRQVLTPLARLADRTGCAVLGNAHFNKSGGSDPLSLVMGSAAFGNVARAALGFVRDTEADDESCVISQVKNNLGRLDLPSLRYRIEEAFLDTDEGPASVGRLVMLGESDRSVADILRDRRGRDDSDDQNDVEAWLAELLGRGPMASNDIYRAADASGYSRDQAKRAKKKLGILATHPDIKGPWFWEMPQGSDKERNGAPFGNPAPLHLLGAPLGGDAADDDTLCPSCDKPFDLPSPACSVEHDVVEALAPW